MEAWRMKERLSGQFVWPSSRVILEMHNFKQLFLGTKSLVPLCGLCHHACLVFGISQFSVVPCGSDTFPFPNTSHLFPFHILATFTLSSMTEPDSYLVTTHSHSGWGSLYFVLWNAKPFWELSTVSLFPSSFSGKNIFFLLMVNLFSFALDLPLPNSWDASSYPSPSLEHSSITLRLLAHSTSCCTAFVKSNSTSGEQTGLYPWLDFPIAFHCIQGKKIQASYMIHNDMALIYFAHDFFCPPIPIGSPILPTTPHLQMDNAFSHLPVSGTCCHFMEWSFLTLLHWANYSSYAKTAVVSWYLIFAS